VSAHGASDGFDVGPAQITAVGLIGDPGITVDTQEWTRKVEIVNQPE
jgi:hypothetical protein